MTRRRAKPLGDASPPVSSPQKQVLVRRMATLIRRFPRKVEHRLQRAVGLLRNLALIKLLEVAGGLTIVAAAVQYFSEAETRYHERNSQLWAVINTAAGTRSDGGRSSALEQLADRGVSLEGIELTGAQLRFTDLPYGYFAGATLDSVDFSGANLCGADFTGASLRGATFTFSNLRGAIFAYADLRGATIQWAKVQHASFAAADLRRARIDTFFDSTSFFMTDLRNATLGSMGWRETKLDWANLDGLEVELPSDSANRGQDSIWIASYGELISQGQATAVDPALNRDRFVEWDSLRRLRFDEIRDPLGNSRLRQQTWIMPYRRLRHQPFGFARQWLYRLHPRRTRPDPATCTTYTAPASFIGMLSHPHPRSDTAVAGAEALHTGPRLRIIAGDSAIHLRVYRRAPTPP